MKHIYRILIAAVLWITASAQAQTWVGYTTANSQLPADSVLAMSIDPSGNIWVCLAGNTVAADFGKLDGKTWTDYYDSIGGGYPEQVYYYDGILWDYSYNGPGFTNITVRLWEAFTNPVDNDADFITSDNHGQLWMDGQGVDVLRTTGHWNHFSAAQTATQFPNDGAGAMACDSNGFTYIAFDYYGGVDKLNGATGQGTYINYTDSVYANIPENNVVSIAVDWNSNIWCATDAGVYELYANGSGAKVWSTDSSFTWISNNVYCVAVDHCGNVWIGTDGGVAMYNGSTWTNHTTLDTPGLLSDTVNNIYVDASGHLWFCTNGGLAEFKPAVTEQPALSDPPNNAITMADSMNFSWDWDCPNTS